jgi:hypothetical protein
MIRPFGLTDVLLMRGLQRHSTSLAIEQILTHPQAPLWIALTAPWPWAGVGVATYILDEQAGDIRRVGFAQLMERAGRPEADLLWLAPALQADDRRAEEIWRQLLAHCGQAAGAHGLNRVFASIPAGGPEQNCLREAGFSFYARETIYRLAVIPALAVQPAGLRPQQPRDSWALQRLYTGGTPRLVQLAEGALSGEVGSPPLAWWEPDRWQGCVWEPAGEARGAVQVHLGRAGHWLRLWGVNLLLARELRGLIEEGLRMIGASRQGRQALPVYATVRDYEVGLGGALTGLGFAPYLERARFVKHVLAQVRETQPVVIPALEVRADAPAHSRAHANK